MNLGGASLNIGGGGGVSFSFDSYDEERMLAHLFHILDTDGNGYLCYQELAAFGKALQWGAEDMAEQSAAASMVNALNELIAGLQAGGSHYCDQHTFLNWEPSHFPDRDWRTFHQNALTPILGIFEIRLCMSTYVCSSCPLEWLAAASLFFLFPEIFFAHTVSYAHRPHTLTETMRGIIRHICSNERHATALLTQMKSYY